MRSFSIIIPTISRRKELDNLLESITKIDYSNILEVIIVDQNKRDFLTDIIEKYKKVLTLKYYNVNFKGVSKARNYGAKYASGEILSFPDDDSTILKETFSRVNEEFDKNEELSAIFGKVVDKDSKMDIIHYINHSSKVKYSNLFRTAIECSFFIKKEEFIKIGGFDEKLGLGVFYGFDEGADIFLRLMYKKKKMKFVNEAFFYHPNKKEEINNDKYYKMGLGNAGLAKKHWKRYKKVIPYIYLILKIIKSNILIIKGRLTNNKILLERNRILIKGRMDGIKSKEEI